MNYRIILLAGTLAGATTAVSAQEATAEADGSVRKINNQYICTFDATVSRGNVESESHRAVGNSLGQVLHTYKNAIKGFAVRMPIEPGQGHVTKLKKNNPNVAGCEQDQEMKAVFFKRPGGGGGTPSPQSTPWGITKVGGPSTQISGKAWVIDTGVQSNHPDLNVDTGNSRTFVGGTAFDENGHGTHVAGTIAAKNNTIGVIGVAPGATVVSVRVLNRQGRGTNSGVIAGVDYVASAASPGDVANMSLGGGPSNALDTAVKNAASKGIKFALAAGNEADDADNHSPGRAEGPNIYTVSAMSSSGAFASFSNYGNPPVDVAAPGVSVLSTYKGSGYATLSGTSMAAPHVAGLLLTGGVGSSGKVTGDPDGDPDPIAHR